MEANVNVVRAWEDLPDDCWGEILARLDGRHLEPAVRVCKLFLTISNKCRTTLTLSPPTAYQTFPSTLPLTLYSRFPNLRYLHVRFKLPDLDSFVRQLALSGLPLQSIQLANQSTRFPVESMRLLGSSMSRSLRSLSLTGFDVFTQEDLFVLADKFYYLHSLDLDCPGHYDIPNMEDTMTDEGIRVLSSKLVFLVSLSFNATYFDDGFSEQALLHISSNCPSITNLKARVFCKERIDINCFSFFTSLTSLELHNVIISDAGLLRLSQAKLKLVKLILKHPRNRSDIDGGTMCEFLSSCQSLCHLVLRNLRFSPCMTKTNLGASIPKSQVIRIDNCKNLPYNLLFQLLKSCPKLEELYLFPTYVPMVREELRPVHRGLRVLSFNSQWISDEILMLICSVCPSLELIKIRDNWSAVTEEGIKAVINARCCNLNSFERNGNEIALHSNFTLYKEKP